MTPFSDQEYLRYTRHIQLAGVGVDGQQKLKNTHVLIIGCGGLGAPVSYYLAAAGVGTITLVDGDTVDLTNLQRQIIYTETDVGEAKASCSQRRLQQLNSDINIHAVCEPLTTSNASALIQAADLVLDCTDNFSSRYLINDLCKSLKKHWLYASVYQFSGQCALFNPEQSCFRCVFPNAPLDAPDCNSAGVLGVLPGLLGTIQATEAIKFLLGMPSAISNTLMLVETDNMQFQKIALQHNEQCPCCQPDYQFNPEQSDYIAANESDDLIGKPLSPSVNTNIDTADNHQLNPALFDDWLQRDNVIVIDVRDTNERQSFHLGGEHIPLQQLADQTDDLLTALENRSQETTVLLYCQSGIRSKQACDSLLGKNINALSVTGGISQILKHRLKP